MSYDREYVCDVTGSECFMIGSGCVVTESRYVI